jgi:hypothetical protein
MWKQFYDALATIFTVLQKLERQEQEIKELRQEQKRMMTLIQRLAYEQQRSHERRPRPSGCSYWKWRIRF